MLLNRKNQRGISLYLTIVVLSVLTAALLATIGISVSQIKVIETIGDSVVAFYAADAGIEQILVNRQAPVSIPPTLLGGASYKVDVYASTSPECSASNYCLISTGSYQNIQRAIEIKY